MSNYTDDLPLDVDGITPDKPREEFQGVFVPVGLWRAMKDEVLTPTSLLLWLRINSFQKGGKRCYMSNAVLGRELKLLPRRVRQLLAGLEQAGFLIKDTKNHQRILTATMPEKYNPYPQKTDERGMRFGAGGAAINCQGGGNKLPGGAAINCHRERHDSEKDSLSRPQSGAGQTVRPSAGRWRRLAEKLSNAISAVRRVNCTSSITSWAKSFELLHTKDKVEFCRIKRALAWYCQALPLRYREKYFIVIESGSTFRSKFQRLEAAMDRELSAEAENGNGIGGQYEGESRVVGRIVNHKKKVSIQERYEDAGGPSLDVLKQMKDELKGDESDDLRLRWLKTFGDE